ncbi:6167_t:CDS:2 [Entrophospora sp. SA101]|nr:8326_t:CDS:2 [Entrophospora sp. SA101]CAJ0648403.1 14036_t:CDS:2 [Entrophospora sp. SA101]CAJ0755674.1 6167_t:CDS:2 [Entrophospora sp. SA101]CAJ0842550.1 14067_t:CDS:2 [Entrophospora sp. SA101]
MKKKPFNSPNHHQIIKKPIAEEGARITQRSERFRESLDQSQLERVGIKHDHRKILSKQKAPVQYFDVVDDFLDVFEIYIDTQISIDNLNKLPLSINDSINNNKRLLARDFFNEHSPPIRLNTLYQKQYEKEPDNVDYSFENVVDLELSSPFRSKNKNSRQNSIHDIEMIEDNTEIRPRSRSMSIASSMSDLMEVDDQFAIFGNKPLSPNIRQPTSIFSSQAIGNKIISDDRPINENIKPTSVFESHDKKLEVVSGEKKVIGKDPQLPELSHKETVAEEQDDQKQKKDEEIKWKVFKVSGPPSCINLHEEIKKLPVFPGDKKREEKRKQRISNYKRCNIKFTSLRMLEKQRRKTDKERIINQMRNIKTILRELDRKDMQGYKTGTKAL